jgi:hypothetical protein
MLRERIVAAVAALVAVAAAVGMCAAGALVLGTTITRVVSVLSFLGALALAAAAIRPEVARLPYGARRRMALLIASAIFTGIWIGTLFPGVWPVWVVFPAFVVLFLVGSYGRWKYEQWQRRGVRPPLLR